MSIAEASAKPHRDQLKTSARKKARSTNRVASDYEQTQRENKRSGGSRLDLSGRPDPSDADMEALLRADAELARFESDLTESQGGRRATAAE